MPENDQASRPPLLVRLFLLVAARSPLDLEQVREPRPPFVRYAVLWLGVIVCSLLAIPVTSTMTSDFGFAGPTMLQAASPVWSTIAMAILVIVYSGLAFVLARELNPAVALFVIGWGFGVIALGTSGISEFAWSEGSLWMLGFETIIWSFVLGFLVWLVMRVSGGLPDVSHDWRAEPIGSFASLSSKPSLLAFVCGLIALPLSWLLLADILNAQALGAAVLASFFAGMAGRVAAPRLDPILIYFSIPFLGGIAQLVIASGWSGSLPDALVVGDIPRLACLMPLDWVAGSLIGVSMGVGWARSFIVQDVVEDTAS
jgi:hypothetical protein